MRDRQIDFINPKLGKRNKTHNIHTELQEIIINTIKIPEHLQTYMRNNE